MNRVGNAYAAVYKASGHASIIRRLARWHDLCVPPHQLSCSESSLAATRSTPQKTQAWIGAGRRCWVGGWILAASYDGDSRFRRHTGRYWGVRRQNAHRIRHRRRGRNLRCLPRLHGDGESAIATGEAPIGHPSRAGHGAKYRVNDNGRRQLTPLVIAGRSRPFNSVKICDIERATGARRVIQAPAARARPSLGAT